MKSFLLKILISLITIIKIQTGLKDDQIYVGYSKQCIDPDKKYGPIPLRGYGNNQYRLANFTDGSQKLMRSLYATCIALKDNLGNIALLITVDSEAVYANTIDQISQEINNKTNISIANIFISATHAHSAPDYSFQNSAYMNLVYTCRNYTILLKSQIVKAAQLAIKDLKPAYMYTKKINIVLENGKNAMNFVRHYYTNNYYRNGDLILSSNNHGTVSWNNGKMDYAYRKTHVTVADNTMQLLQFKVDNAKDILLVNWQAHLCVSAGSTQTTINPDFVGDLRDILDKKLNARTAYFTGAAGNVVASTEESGGGIKGISKEGSQNKTEHGYYLSKLYAGKLAEYIFNDTQKFTKMKSGKIKTIKKYITFLKRTENDTELITNAKYVQRIWNSEYEDVRKMIIGKYNWGDDYVFPKGVDASGAFLRYLISIGLKLSNYYIISNTSSGYSCKLVDGMIRDYVGSLAVQVGVYFDKRVYSPYHASSVVRNSNTKPTDIINISLSVLGIGDIAFTGAPYEMFDTNGKYVKEHSKYKTTFIFELLNGGSGYVPSQAAYDYGCYEADTTVFPPGSGEVVQNNLVNYLKNIRNEVTGIKVVKKPDKCEYVVNEENLDLEGGKVNISYSDGYFKIISMGNEFLNITGFDNKELGTKKIVLDYEGKSDSFEVVVAKKSHTFLICFIVILVIVLAGVGAFYYIKKKKKGNLDYPNMQFLSELLNSKN